MQVAGKRRVSVRPMNKFVQTVNIAAPDAATTDRAKRHD
jgi:hypothetical protein